MITLKELDTIEPGTALESLRRAQLTDLQRGLALICYPVSVIDGAYGPRTRNAWAEFKEDIGEGNPGTVSANSVEVLKDKVRALDSLISVSLENTDQVKDAIGEVCKAMGIGLKTQIAYVLATAQWETAHTFKPVKEAFWLSENWRKNHLHYYPFYGRGYVQLTWKRNYEKYASILGIDLAGNPDLALQANTALFVLVHGSATGTFTGRRLEEFINENKTDYKNARRVINGLDKWPEIQRLAEDYADEL